jgi:hypothetical protein
MVTGFLSFDAQGFLRDFIAERSYSVFMTYHFHKKILSVFVTSLGRDGTDNVACFTLAMIDKKQTPSCTHTQQQKASLVHRETGRQIHHGTQTELIQKKFRASSYLPRPWLNPART